jgi:hypothetical protein
MPMVNVLESTLKWTKGEVIVNSGIGSHTPCFSLDSAADKMSKGDCQPKEYSVICK